LSEKFLTRNPIILDAFDLVIAHIVLVGIALVAFATLPLYKKLIMKINTRKVVESNEMQGEIDTSAEL
jgi:S-adenosylmethionine:diacylglycerol 3-amino-3-carboxypropyl transferase